MLFVAFVTALRLLLPQDVTEVNLFNRDGQDPREIQAQVGLSGRPYAPIGQLLTKDEVTKSQNGATVRGRMSGTATLIAPCFALSSAHEVFGDGQSDFEELIFRSVSQDGKSMVDTAAWPVAWGKTRKFADDWALVRLVRCEGRRLGWIDVSEVKMGALGGAAVETAGFPADRDANRLWRDPKCRIYGFDLSVGLLSTDCAARSGSSGSPLLTRNSKGSLEMVGMIVQELNPRSEVIKQFDRRNHNLAIFVPGLRETIQAAIATSNARD